MTNPAPLPDPACAALAARLQRPVVLVGMMGVGKSSVGKRLAAALGYAFTDADEEIEQAAQMPISEIFDRFGEAHFRDGERRVIGRLLDTPHQVLATGGGAFVQPATRAMILDKGIAVWLDSDVDTIVERVGRNDKRPLLRGGNVRETVARLHAERAPAYALAPIKVMSTRGPHADTVNRVLEELGKWQ